jgi:hypothetical protein
MHLKHIFSLSRAANDSTMARSIATMIKTLLPID